MNLSIYLCAVTSVSMNLNPSNLGSIFSIFLDSQPFGEIGGIAEEEEEKAAVEKAMTEATTPLGIFIIIIIGGGEGGNPSTPDLDHHQLWSFVTSCQFCP